MVRRSAGILAYRLDEAGAKVLLAHPGGPFWAKRDLGAWSIPKGEYADGEDPLAAAIREFEEETGWRLEGEFHALGEVTQAGGKRVVAWAIEKDFDPRSLRSNTFSMVWPPKSGVVRSFPEIDRVEWFGLDEASRRILPGQRALLERLDAVLADMRST